MRHKLIDGQGNFGSTDGDPPAAMLLHRKPAWPQPAMSDGGPEGRHGWISFPTTTSRVRSRRFCRVSLPQPAGERLAGHPRWAWRRRCRRSQPAARSPTAIVKVIDEPECTPKEPWKYP